MLMQLGKAMIISTMHKAIKEGLQATHVTEELRKWMADL